MFPTMNQPDHSSRGHAEFSPSQLKYLAGCAGYHGKDGSSAAAEMGTRIHEAIEILDPSNLQSEEEVSIYQEIVSDQEAYLANYKENRRLTEEQSEIALDVELDGTKTWGTCDYLVIFDHCDAILIDYKTGISKIDRPSENYQAKAYTLGVFQKYPEVLSVSFVFFVPQRNEILQDTFYREDMDDLVKELSAVILKAEKVRPKWNDSGTPNLEDLNPTVDCRFCRHEDVCPALGGIVVEVAKKLNPSLPDVDLDSVEDPQVVEQLWTIQKIVTNWAMRFKKRAITLAQDGMEFPTLQLKVMGGSRSVTDPQKFFDLAKAYGMTEEEIMNEVSIPLGKISTAIGSKAERGEKKKMTAQFAEDCEAAGIVEKSAPRYTLS